MITNKENKEILNQVEKNETQKTDSAENASQVIYDAKQKRRYLRGQFLGKGGFAKCYEVVDSEDNKSYACKIVAKSQLTKPHQKEKMASEISIHRSLNHPNIVKFCHYFEDKLNVYILLEVCHKRTLLELHKRRKVLTDPEVRFYFHQIVLSCKYMHDNDVIHRDLKLGNLFLDDSLHVKVGDFGLAAKIQFPGERKKTMCGTPNYIAPEILNKSGHSFKVDVWSLGCILYTLYVGVPPFETSNVRETYNRIKKNFYTIPSKVPKPAQFLIAKLLQSDPERRPDINQVIADSYFTSGFLPSCLPLSSLTVAPRFPNNMQNSFLQSAERTPTVVSTTKPTTKVVTEVNPKPEERSHALRVCDSKMDSFDDGQDDKPPQDPKDCYLSIVFDLLSHLLTRNPHKLPRIAEEEAEDPASAPFYWVTKWVDYSERYGIGYQLSDNSFGVLFNDQTRMISTEDRGTMAYIDAEGVETYLRSDPTDPALIKKKTLLLYFYDYMHSNLLTAGSDIIPTKIEDEMVRLPTLKLWRRASSHIVFLLSCGIFQANFFDDHCKLIICPHLSSVTFIDHSRRSHTYRFGLLEKYGCSQYFVSRLKMVIKSVKEMMASLANPEADIQINN